MTQERRSPGSAPGPATKPLDTAEDNPWWGQNAPEVSLRWWESVPTAYWQGLVDGAALERARREPVDDRVHRTAVRSAIRLVEQAEQRERTDRGEAAA